MEFSSTVAWEIENLSSQLKEIHPTFTKVEVDTDELQMHFCDGHPMSTSEFLRGSPTRNILEHLEDIIFGDSDEDDDSDYLFNNDNDDKDDFEIELEDSYEMVIADLLADELNNINQDEQL